VLYSATSKVIVVLDALASSMTPGISESAPVMATRQPSFAARLFAMDLSSVSVGGLSRCVVVVGAVPSSVYVQADVW
jgi:hypothetical protein